MALTTSRRAVIFHGYRATPDDHWFGWLAEQLDSTGITTHIPPLPDPAAPDRDRWQAEVAAVLGTPGPDTIVVAHSLGCLAVLRHLATLVEPWRMGALVLVSGFVDPLPALPVLDGFVADGVILSGMPDHIGSISILRSDDDPIVPPAHTDRLARLLDAPVQIVPGAGHFLAADGVTSLPAVLDAVT
ncbi:alpha/beta hydrolase [Rhodococcus sp. 05-340-1]|uniref:RBBP9/YdeN family alpha/beta hydrolase n=1 Tax=unclassified Rhodococcus (in: high G+C Gram-positive bacteria) TaxID=192944 RepID=UPI000B9BC304|nr:MULTISPECIES: alpha/beta hydrolase [unclassified Rhodococcus (in: high G+C Gram-positive bacteria)]OZD70612.1 alpha/beta hydrolase [Rhodococcus sp. 05-340-1]OZD72344.1 alpha/beta hydrolase [Rhodococcus sp. 05-340-2]